MANDKKFVVKNGLTTQNISFVDAIGSANNTITVSMLDSDTLSFTGDSGQLFSITDTQSGTIFAVNDISGVPSIEVDDDGTIRFAELFGNVLIGTATDNGTDKLQINGSVSANSFVGDLTGSADSLSTARSIILTGDVSGSATFDGTANATITAVVADDSHNHIISNVDGLQSALDAKLDSSSYTAADVLSKIITVDGAGSGLDADLLDGQQGSYYLDYNNFTNTPTDSDTTYDLVSPGSGIIRLSDSANSNDDIIVVGSGATSVTSNTTHIIVSSTDNNTTYSAGNGIDLSGTTFSVAAGSGLTQDATGLSHANTSTQASLTALTGADVVSDIDLDGFGHVTSLATRTMTLADFDSNLSSFVSTFTLPTVDGSNGQVLTTDGAGTLSFATFSGGGYTDADVDTHLNTGTAANNQILSWTGSDYDWINQSAGGSSVETSDTPPVSPSDGDLWFNTNDTTLSVYYVDANTSQWVVTSGPQGQAGADGADGADAVIQTSNTAPLPANNGDLWFNTDDASLYFYYEDGTSGQYVAVSGPQGPQGEQGPAGEGISTGKSIAMAIVFGG